MFKSPVEYLNEVIAGLMTETANAAFAGLKIYLFAPTDLSRYEYVSEAYDFVFTLSVIIGSVFFIYNLICLLVQKVGGYEQRSMQEVMVKTVLGGTMAVLAPFLLQRVMIPINNAIVQLFLNKGVQVDSFSRFTAIPGAGTTAVLIAGFLMALLFVILAIQYVIRTAELLIILIMSPLAAWSIVNDEMNIWSIWWREMTATVFTQSLQIIIIWLAFNTIGDGAELKDFIVGFGFLIFCIMSPQFLRRFLYSTGAGKKIAGLATGAGKSVLFRYVTAKLIG
ncbi:conjugal transfer protein TrbL family protein [Ectobacillus ponti]|uniref:DUF6102 family protein n=1 Tax=Ectobacillus ponti TaxID=2961894 RepID=A0AA42BSZ2_9BACI|nr:conjugal transfer protein TrbL family protein [Ectobacillus ponti]MCP8968953.1 DUF6102 family protein [Ectobacillus ponti]